MVTGQIYSGKKEKKNYWITTKSIQWHNYNSKETLLLFFLVIASLFLFPYFICKNMIYA